jgi:hypothetical protein
MLVILGIYKKMNRNRIEIISRILIIVIIVIIIKITIIVIKILIPLPKISLVICNKK